MGTNSQPDQTEPSAEVTEQSRHAVSGECALNPNDEQYRAILLALTDNVVVLNAEWRIQYINHVSPGLDEKEVVGSEWLLWLEEADRPRAREAILHVLASGEPTEIEFRAVGPQRQMTWFQVKFARLASEPAPLVVLIAQDITERKRAENKNRQITRLYATLSQINQTIVRVKEPLELYRAICQVAIQYGEFAFAWIGLLDQATGKVTPVTYAGSAVGYVENLNIDLNDAATGQGPTGIALRTGKIATSGDIQTDQAMGAWRAQALARHFRASASVPFRLQGTTVGTLNLYVREPFFFSDPEEMRLLQEMGLDISFALDKMQVEAERQRAEQAVRESEARYRQLFDTSPDALFVLDATGHFVDVNQVAVERYGYTRAELMQMTARDLAVPDLRDQTAARVRQTLVTGAQFEWRQQRKDGSEIPAEINARRITLNGQPCILSSVRDVTERKRIENELRKSRERYQNFVQQSYEAIYCTEFDEPIDTTLTIEEQIDTIYQNAYMGECNQAMAAMYGLTSPDAFVGQRMIDAHGGKDNPVNRATFRQFIEGGYRALNVETEEVTSEGERRWFISNNMGVVENGCLLRIWGTSLDITERKRAEETLRASEASLRESQRVAHVGDWAWDTQSNSVTWSDEMKRIFGLDPATFAGDLTQVIAQAIHPADQAKVNASNQAVLTEQKPAPMEYRVVLPDQSVRTIWAVPGNKIVDASGKILKLTGIVQDITERKQAEERVQQQLKQLDALRSIDNAINANFSLNITLDIFLRQVMEQLKVDAAAVLLFNPTTLSVEFAAGVGFHSSASQRWRLRLGQGFAGRVAVERRRVSASLDMPTEFVYRPGFADEKFCAYHGVPLVAKGQLKGVLEVFARATSHPTTEWFDFLETLGGQAAIAIDNVQLFEGLQRSNLELALAYDATIEGWSRALDLRDKETEGHTQRVVELTLQMARALGVAEAGLVHVRRGALLHDIGKLGVPDAILLKPGKLTDDEWKIMRQHPTFAYDMLAPIAYLRPALDIPYCHHEKWDGSGYPRGLAGEQIPLVARIFAAVDVWDALRSDRPYRKGWADDEVYAYIRAQVGVYFDPQVVETLFQTLARGLPHHGYRE